MPKCKLSLTVWTVGEINSWKTYFSVPSQLTYQNGQLTTSKAAQLTYNWTADLGNFHADRWPLNRLSSQHRLPNNWLQYELLSSWFILNWLSSKPLLQMRQKSDILNSGYKYSQKFKNGLLNSYYHCNLNSWQLTFLVAVRADILYKKQSLPSTNICVNHSWTSSLYNIGTQPKSGNTWSETVYPQNISFTVTCWKAKVASHISYFIGKLIYCVKEKSK